jgi:hypothetical protein
MSTLAGAMLAVAALIHLVPVTGALGAGRLTALYGIEVTGPDLAILLRHRAVLFGIVGGLLSWAVVRPETRTLALVVGFASVVSFLALALGTGRYNAQLRGVVVADLVALVCLVVAAAAHWRSTAA